MKLLFDFLPVFLFFVAFKLADIYVATAVAMAAAIIQSAWLYWRHRRLEPSQMMVLVLIAGLGTLTLIFQDPDFIKWKPTLVNWLFGAALLGSLLLGKRNLLQRMLGDQLSLPDFVWRRLALGWTSFFVAVGALNLYVAYFFELDTWVNFKLYGMIGLTLAFGLLQAVYIGRYLPVTAEQPTDEEK